MTTQTEKVLRHIQEHGSITSLEAVMVLGITRLSARIWELERAGWIISKTWEEHTNVEGQTSRYLRYSLGEFADTLN